MRLAEDSPSATRIPRFADFGRPAPLPNAAASANSLVPERLKNAVRLFQRLLASHIEPRARNLPRLHRRPLVEPLHKTPGLVGIISRGKIGGDGRHRRF